MPNLDIYLGIDLHPAQELILSSTARFIIACCGRRFGKTTSAKVRVAEVAAARGGRWGYFTLKNQTLDQVWDEIKFWLKPLYKPEGKSEQFHRLDLLTGGIAEFWSVENEDAGLSRYYDEVFCDEWAIVKSDLPWTRNIRPTLTDTRGRAFFFSTPRGINHFYDLYDRGSNPDFPDWQSFQFPTSANPHIDPQEIREAKITLPERRFREEYLAEFLAGSGEVFRNIDLLCTADPIAYPEPGHVYSIGVDWGRVEDFSVFVVYDIIAHRMVFMDRSNQIDLLLQVTRLKALAAVYNPMIIVAEENSVGGVMEALYQTALPVIPFKTTNASKLVLVDMLEGLLENKSITLLDNDILKRELKSYEPTPLPSGMTRYSAPAGRHDDCVMGLMLAVYGGESSYAGEADILRFY